MKLFPRYLMLSLALWGAWAPCAFARPVMVLRVGPVTPPEEEVPRLQPASPELVADEDAINWTPTVTAGEFDAYSASSLPTGASIDSSTGAITGTLSTPGKWRTVVTAWQDDDDDGTLDAGEAFDRVWLPVSVYSSTANISQATGFPYYANVAHRKLTLTEDITVNGSAFAIIASNVSLDLNGHTITYDNATPIAIANHSFETGTGGAATGWNFTNAANAARFQGTWLINEVYDGDYSLKFSVTTGNQYVSSSGTITLAANTTYSLSAMGEYGGQGEDENPGVVGYIQLVGTGGETTREVQFTGTNYRGIQFREATFTTGGTAETYTVRAGITGHGSSTQPFFIDDIKVQKTECYGVATQVQATSHYPDLTSTGNGTGATILNGTIVQGSDAGTWCHGVFLHEITGVTVHDVDITVAGANTSCLLGLDATNPSNIAGNCTLTSNVQTITSRDNYDGAVCKGVSGVVVNNTITNGPHVGITYSDESSIWYNTITLEAKYTNGFAISTGFGCNVFRNSITCHEGEQAARGILALGSLAKPTTVSENVVRVKALANSQEYEGVQLGGTYCLQVDTYGYVTHWRNSLYAYAVDGCDAYGIRCTDLNQPVEGYEESIFVIADESGSHGAAFSFTNSDGTKINLHDITVTTNDGLIGYSNLTEGIELANCAITVANLIGSPKAYTVDDYPDSMLGVHVTATFSGTGWADAESQDYAEESTPAYITRFGGGNASSRMEVTVE